MNDQSIRGQLPPSLLNPMQMAQPQEEESLDLLEYWRAIDKRKWSIAGLAVLVAILTILVVLSMRPTYRSTATLLIEQGKAKVVSIEEVYGGVGANREYFQTQAEILKSDELARRVIQKLNLTTHPDYDPRAAEKAGGTSWSLAALFASFAGEQKAPTEEDIAKGVLRRFVGSLVVTPIRNSQLVQISFTAFDKELAAKVPNTLAETYIEADLEARVAMTQKAGAWLTARMGDLRQKLEGSERALQDYRERERIVDAKGLALSGASKALEEATTGLVSVRAKRAEAESLYNQVQAAKAGRSPGGVESIPAVLRHPTVSRLKEQEADAERKAADAAKRYGPEHPKMLQASGELAAARESTKRQIDIVIAGVAKEYEIAKANEQSLASALGQSKAEIQGLNRKEFQLGVLEREAGANRQLYDLFMNRFKETNVASDLQSTAARVVDPATVSNVPYAPKKTQIVAIATFLALVVGVLLALLLDRLSNTMNATADVEKRLGLPVLGVLQKIKSKGKQKGFKSELAFFNDAQSVFAESVRTIRTSVLMAAVDSPHKVIVITSSVPAEGKTTVSFNLACALAQVKKVLLIEADLRRPKISRLLGGTGETMGLSDLITGAAKLEDCVIEDEKSKLTIIPAGTIPPNPLEVLSSKRFHDLMAHFKDVFEIVIIDSAPLHLVSDSLILSELADGTIFVVRADSTPHQLAQTCVKRLRSANAALVGVVLNQLDVEKAERYYGEYGAYGHYKGYKYGYEANPVNT